MVKLCIHKGREGTEVQVDASVQENAITFSTNRLENKIIEKFLAIAEQGGSQEHLALRATLRKLVRADCTVFYKMVVESTRTFRVQSELLRIERLQFGFQGTVTC